MLQLGVVTSIPDRTMKALAFAATVSLALLGMPVSLNASWDEVGYVLVSGTNDTPHINACKPNINCVSINYLEPLNRYVSPLQTVNEWAVAFQWAVSDMASLKDQTIMKVSSKDFYIRLAVPVTAPGSLNDLKILFSEEGGVANIRCEAQVTLLPPPFCLEKNRSNGNMDQWTTVEELALSLGPPPTDQKQMQKRANWTPMFFDSDKVPGFYDKV